MKRTKNLTFHVYESIKEQMVRYEIVPGQRLVFTDIAKQLKVSRTPVNNALSMLAHEGYLDFVPNQGYSVHKLTRKEAENLYELRDALEIGFIAMAVRNQTREGLGEIKKQMTAYENALGSQVQRKLFVIDTDYHLAILSMAGNEQLLREYTSLCRKIFLKINVERLAVERISSIIEEHELLYDAIRKKDVIAAKNAVIRHHGNSKSSLWPILFPEV